MIMSKQIAFDHLVFYDGSNEPAIQDIALASRFNQEAIFINATGSAVSPSGYIGLSQSINAVPSLSPLPDHVNPIWHRWTFGDRADVPSFVANYLANSEAGKPTATIIQIEMKINIEKRSMEASSRITELLVGQAVMFPITGLYGDHVNVVSSHILYGRNDQLIQGKALPMKPIKIVNQDFTWFQKNYEILKKKYLNEWIVIANNDVISHDHSFNVAIQEARNKGLKRPFITRVSPEGWEE